MLQEQLLLQTADYPSFQTTYNSPTTHREAPTSVTFQTFVSTNFDRNSRVVSKYNINTMGLPPKKLSRSSRTKWP
jgi:hypothetical protein